MSRIVIGDGHVALVDHIGSDERICQAARTSFGNGEKQYSAAENRKLIRYLMRNKHTGPFEFVSFTFHVVVPMDTWRQWVRHRTASINEYSTRYKSPNHGVAIPRPGSWRRQAKSAKQGSDGYVDQSMQSALTQAYQEAARACERAYTLAIEHGVAKEQARCILPLATYTEAYWSINLHNLLHFLSLRMDYHAQQEIREYAVAMYHLIQPIVPMAIEAFEDYVLQSISITGPEREIVGSLNLPPAPETWSGSELSEYEYKRTILG